MEVAPEKKHVGEAQKEIGQGGAGVNTAPGGSVWMHSGFWKPGSEVQASAPAPGPVAGGRAPWVAGGRAPWVAGGAGAELGGGGGRCAWRTGG